MSRVSEFKDQNLSRFKSVSEELTIVSTGNIVNLSFEAGSGNIAYVANPTGPITLNVSNIPTTNFNNKSLTFSLIINQSTIPYECNSITFNGVAIPIKWQNGVIGKGNASSIDVFNFVAINRIGLGAIGNYIILGNVNGSYK